MKVNRNSTKNFLYSTLEGVLGKWEHSKIEARVDGSTCHLSTRTESYTARESWLTTTPLFNYYHLFLNKFFRETVKFLFFCPFRKSKLTSSHPRNFYFILYFIIIIIIIINSFSRLQRGTNNVCIENWEFWAKITLL